MTPDPADPGLPEDQPNSSSRQADMAASRSPEDGTDPRVFFDRRQPRRKGGRKALQLCAQVSRALSYALSDCDDDILRNLYIDSVVPAPDEKRLMVTVINSLGSEPPPEVLEHLHLHYGRLRGEVARSIHRKRAPELSFQVAVQPPAPSDMREPDSGEE